MAHTVGSKDDLISAVFELSTEQNFLVAGSRSLRGELTVNMAKAGNQMVLRAIRVSLDPPVVYQTSGCGVVTSCSRDLLAPENYLLQRSMAGHRFE